MNVILKATTTQFAAIKLALGLSCRKQTRVSYGRCENEAFCFASALCAGNMNIPFKIFLNSYQLFGARCQEISF